MKKNIVILAAFAALVLSGCNEIIVTDPGDPVTKVFEIDGNYTALEISNAFDVYVPTGIKGQK